MGFCCTLVLSKTTSFIVGTLNFAPLRIRYTALHHDFFGDLSKITGMTSLDNGTVSHLMCQRKHASRARPKCIHLLFSGQ